MWKTKALYVRYKLWYISSPYSAKYQHEMTKFKVMQTTWAHDGNVLILCLNLDAAPTCSVTGQFGHIAQVRRIGIIANK